MGSGGPGVGLCHVYIRMFWFSSLRGRGVWQWCSVNGHVIGTVFFSVSNALISFRARGVPTSARRTLGTLHSGNVGVFVTAKHPRYLVGGLNSLRFSKCVAMGKDCYFATNRRPVCGNYVPRRSVRQLVAFRRGCPMPFIFTCNGRVFIARIGSEMRTISSLVRVPIPPITSVRRTHKGSVLRVVKCFATRRRGRASVFNGILARYRPVH